MLVDVTIANGKQKVVPSKKDSIVLIACESSGTLRDKCINNGILAFSVDLEEADGKHKNFHIKGDVFKAYEILSQLFEIKMLIGHAPCTYLTNASVGWLWDEKPSTDTCKRGFDRYKAMIEGANFFNDLRDLPIKYKALENPIPHKYSRAIIGKYDMLTQPYHHGHNESKATCFWLDNLPPLFKTKVVKNEGSKLHKLPPSKDRWKLRSKTFDGIAEAMFQQWIRPIMNGWVKA